MKRITTLLLVLVALLAVAGVVSADRPRLDPFTIEGAATNRVSQEFPYLGPDDFMYLTSPDPNVLFAKFRILSEGQASGGLSGPFTMTEWGVADLSTFAGANFGDLSIANTNPTGSVQLRFSGPISYSGVSGAFTFAGGTDAFDKLKGLGEYAGMSSLGPFLVKFTPMEKKERPQCAVFGDDLKPKNKKAEWRLDNEGDSDQTITGLRVFWPADLNGDLVAVKLDGKKIADQAVSTSGDLVPLKDHEKDLRIDAGKTGKLTFEFANGDISEVPSDYTVLVNFGEDCAVPWVAFP